MKLVKKLIRYGNVKFEEPNRLDKFLKVVFLRFFPKQITPNRLTIFRYVMAPLVFYFLLFEQYKLGLVFFAVSSLTDMLDGAMARTRNMITKWGKVHDPLADKILIGMSGAVLVTRFVDFRIILAILVVELLTVLLALRNYEKPEDVSSIIPGKIKMLFQTFGLVLLLVFGIFPLSFIVPVATVFLYFALFFGILNILIHSNL